MSDESPIDRWPGSEPSHREAGGIVPTNKIDDQTPDSRSKRGRKHRTTGQKVAIGLGIALVALAAAFGLFALVVLIFFVSVLSSGGLFPNK